MPNFICKAWTVWEQLDRELDPLSCRDSDLLALEHARLIDMSHHWAQSTLSQYHTKLSILQHFQSSFGVPPLRIASLDRPPSSPSIPIMSAQQYYALRPGCGQAKLEGEGFVSYATARGLRSAASHYLAWDLQVSDPQAAFDALNRPSAESGAIPTDSLAYSYMTSGMSRCLGEESSPSHALLEWHVVWIDTHLNSLYAMALTSEAHAEIARAAHSQFDCLVWLVAGSGAVFPNLV
jgi:hypothetical protein